MRKFNVFFLVFILAFSSIMLGGCQQQQEEEAVTRVVPEVPSINGPSTAPSVQGPSSPPPMPSVSLDPPEAVTEVETVRFELPPGTE